MASSMMSHHSTGSWQTVKPKADEKKKDKKKSREDVQLDRLGIPVDARQNVFADVDRQWQKKTQQAQQVDDNTPYTGAFTGLDIEQSTFKDEPETPNTPPGAEGQSGLPSPPGSYTQEQTGKVKKPKVPRKPKVTIQQVAQGLDIAAVNEYIASLKSKYPSDALAQVTMLADYLLKAFRDVDLPFNNLLQEKPLYQAAELPVNGVPAELTAALTRYLKTLPVDVLGRAVAELMNSIFEGLPESHKSKAGAQPPRAKVGFLLLLSVLLRTSPVALLVASPAVLAGGRTFTSGPRLLHLLWVLHQAALVDEAVGIAVWVRVLLPQLLCTDFSSAVAKRQEGEAASAAVAPMDNASQEAAVEYATGLLKGGGLMARVQAGEAVDVQDAEGAPIPAVPAAAVETIARTCFVDGTGAGIRTPIRSLLASLYPSLSSLAAACSVAQQHIDWVPLALDTAATLSASPFHSVQGDEVVERQALCLLRCLRRSEGAFGVWETKHKGSIKGSSRVLQCLAMKGVEVNVEVQRELGGLLGDAERREQFQQLLQALKKRHSHYLAQGKGWQGAAARASDSAASALSSQVVSARSSGGLLHSVALGAAAVGTAAVLTAVLAHHHVVVSSVVDQHVGPEAAAQVSTLLQQVHAKLSPHTTVAMNTLSPYLQQAADAASPYLQQALVTLSPFLQQATEAAAPILEVLQQHAAELAAKAQEVGEPLLAQLKTMLKDAKPSTA